MFHPTQKQQVVSGVDCAAALIDVMMCSSAHEHLSHMPNTNTLFSLAEGDTGAFIWTQTKQIAQQQGKCATTSIGVWSWRTDRRNGTVGCWSKVQFAVWNRPFHYFICNLVATKSCVDSSDGDGWDWLNHRCLKKMLFFHGVQKWNWNSTVLFCFYLMGNLIKQLKHVSFSLPVVRQERLYLFAVFVKCIVGTDSWITASASFHASSA